MRPWLTVSALAASELQPPRPFDRSAAIRSWQPFVGSGRLDKTRSHERSSLKGCCALILGYILILFVLAITAIMMLALEGINIVI
jgi:hypothetical protein